MARGWESKAVDDQIQDANETRKNGNPRNLSPQQIDAVRQKKVLELSRVRVTSDLENNQDPRYRSLLLRALEDLDAQLARLKAPGQRNAPASPVVSAIYSTWPCLARTLSCSFIRPCFQSQFRRKSPLTTR